MIGQTISHYRVLEKLGEGGMGIVYKAEDTKLKRTVALKFLPPELTRDAEAKERFVREARAASALDHPNVCTVYEIDESGGHTFISMACIEGQDLKDKIEAGPLDLADALDIAFQVALGLQAAHEKGVFHRDLKSGNVRITPKGQAKIMDFGLAKSPGGTTITKTGTTMGTPAYMSPEQARGESVDHRTDIWSLGVILYEMLTGKVPFKGEHEQAVIYSILNQEPTPITSQRKEIPGSLSKTITKSLSKDPAQRYQSVDELLIDLLEAKRDLGVSREPRPGTKKARKRRRAIAISVLAVLALMVMALLLDRARKRVPPVISRVPIGVMFFDNQTGEAKYDYLRKVLADMLITDLGQSRHVQAMTNERMFDLAKSLGHEEMEIIDAPLGFELCKLAGARAMVLGSLTKSGDTFVINTQVLDVDTKKQMAAYRVTGKGEDSILGHLVDDLTDEIKRGMEVSVREIRQEKVNITELTTTSLEAYRYYFAGWEAAYRMDHREAIDNFEKAVALDSNFVEARERLARQYHETYEYDKALQTLEKVKSVSPKLAEDKLIEILALEAYIKHDWDLAVNYLTRLISLDPENIRAHIDLGMAYYRGKMMYDEGISEFKKVLELDPQGVTHHSSFTYNVLGWAYLRKGEFGKARAAFEKYVALLPNQSDPLTSLGELHLTAGNYDQATAAFLRSLEIEPDLAIAHWGLGETFFAKGMYDQALTSYGKYLALSNSKVEQAAGHVLLGRLHYLMGDHAKAVDECNLALKLSPSMIEAHWILGLSFLEEGMIDQAESERLTIEALMEETKTEEPRRYYYHLLGQLQLRRDFRRQALENLNKAAAIKSKDRTFFINALGEAYLRIGDLDQAVEELESVLEMNPNFAQAHYLLGIAYEKKGRKGKAGQHFERFVEIWREADANLPQLAEAKRRLDKM